MEVIFVFWLLCAVGVGAIASSKGRSGVGWFFLAVIISPLIALIIVAVIGQPVPVLSADRTYFGVPYEERRSGEVFAMIDGGRMRFKGIREFITMMEERNAVATKTTPPKLADIQGARETYFGVRFKRDWGRGIVAFVDGRQVRFASYNKFVAAMDESRVSAAKESEPVIKSGQI
jgi:hypothetical protein